jgi:hypothetical protein
MHACLLRMHAALVLSLDCCLAAWLITCQACTGTDAAAPRPLQVLAPRDADCVLGHGPLLGQGRQQQQGGRARGLQRLRSVAGWSSSALPSLSVVLKRPCSTPFLPAPGRPPHRPHQGHRPRPRQPADPPLRHRGGAAVSSHAGWRSCPSALVLPCRRLASVTLPSTPRPSGPGSCAPVALAPHSPSLRALPPPSRAWSVARPDPPSLPSPSPQLPQRRRRRGDAAVPQERPLRRPQLLELLGQRAQRDPQAPPRPGARDGGAVVRRGGGAGAPRKQRAGRRVLAPFH